MKLTTKILLVIVSLGILAGSLVGFFFVNIDYRYVVVGSEEQIGRALYDLSSNDEIAAIWSVRNVGGGVEMHISGPQRTGHGIIESIFDTYGIEYQRCKK